MVYCEMYFSQLLKSAECKEENEEIIVEEESVELFFLSIFVLFFCFSF